MKIFLPLLFVIAFSSCEKEDKPASIYGKYSGVCSYSEGEFFTTVTVDSRDEQTVFLTFADSLVNKVLIASLSENNIELDSQEVINGFVKGYGNIDESNLFLILDVDKYGNHYDCAYSLNK